MRNSLDFRYTTAVFYLQKWLFVPFWDTLILSKSRALLCMLHYLVKCLFIFRILIEIRASGLCGKGLALRDNAPSCPHQSQLAGAELSF
jgi:hypothetical protein